MQSQTVKVLFTVNVPAQNGQPAMTINVTNFVSDGAGGWNIYSLLNGVVEGTNWPSGSPQATGLTAALNNAPNIAAQSFMQQQAG